MKYLSLVLAVSFVATNFCSCECARCDRKNKLKSTEGAAVAKEDKWADEREMSGVYLPHPMM